MKVRIEIATSTFVRFFAVSLVFVAAVYSVMNLSYPITLIVTSIFLALALNPPVSWIARRVPKMGRFGGTLVSYLLVLSLVGGFLVLAIPPSVDQSVKLINNMPEYLDVIQDQQGPIRDFLAKYNLDSQLDEAITNAQDQLTSIAGNIGSTFVSAVSNIFNGIFALVTVLVMTFMILLEAPAWMRRIWSLYTDEAKRDKHRELARKMYNVVTGYVNGQVVVAAIAAVSGFVALAVMTNVFDVPFSLVLPLSGAIFFCSMIPLIGATLAGGVVVLVLLFNSITMALVFLVYFIVYQQIENNVIAPPIQSKKVELSILTVFIAILVGIFAFGFLGALLAVPVAGSLRILVNYQIDERQKRAQAKPENLYHKAKKALTGLSDE